MATAVALWSPVIITGRMPAWWQAWTASLHLRPRRVDHAHQADEGEIFLQFAKVRHPRQGGIPLYTPAASTRRAWLAIWVLASSTWVRASASRGWTPCRRMWVLRESSTSGCPLDHDAVAAAGLGVDGGHALAGGVEGQLCPPEGDSRSNWFLSSPCSWAAKTMAVSVGSPAPAAVWVQGGVRAESANDQSQLLALGGRRPQVSDGHLVAG